MSLRGLGHRQSGAAEDGTNSQNPQRTAANDAAVPAPVANTQAGQDGAAHRRQRWPLLLKEVERQHIEHVVAVSPTLAAAATLLGINETTLRRKLRQYGLK